MVWLYFLLQVDKNDLTVLQSDRLEEIDFDMKLLASKELAELLYIEEHQVNDHKCKLGLISNLTQNSSQFDQIRPSKLIKFGQIWSNLASIQSNFIWNGVFDLKNHYFKQKCFFCSKHDYHHLKRMVFEQGLS